GRLTQGSDGLFYGTVSQGTFGGPTFYGGVFRVDPGTANAFDTVHAFDSLDGYFPIGRLIQARDGWLYGTASGGGGLPNGMVPPGCGAYGCGTIFRIDPSRIDPVTHRPIFEVLHAFRGTDGASPYAGLLEASDGFLYGTTNAGGA